MKNHFDVLINGNKFKVLNYSFKEIEGQKTVVLKTLIKGQDFVIDPEAPAEIVIDGKVVSTDARFEGTLRFKASEEWYYRI